MPLHVVPVDELRQAEEQRLREETEFVAHMALMRHGPRVTVEVRTRYFARDVEGFIDTGASISALGRSQAEWLGLVRGVRTVGGIGGDSHAFDLDEFSIVADGATVRIDQGVGLLNDRHALILGRDFLRHYELVYDGPRGRFSLKHAMPGGNSE